ncbi:protein of unknown function (plasmid) [Caballeronia sp. S22]
MRDGSRNSPRQGDCIAYTTAPCNRSARRPIRIACFRSIAPVGRFKKPFRLHDAVIDLEAMDIDTRMAENRRTCIDDLTEPGLRKLSSKGAHHAEPVPFERHNDRRDCGTHLSDLHAGRDSRWGWLFVQPVSDRRRRAPAISYRSAQAVSGRP